MLNVNFQKLDSGLEIVSVNNFQYIWLTLDSYLKRHNVDKDELKKRISIYTTQLFNFEQFNQIHNFYESFNLSNSILKIYKEDELLYTLISTRIIATWFMSDEPYLTLEMLEDATHDYFKIICESSKS